MKQTETIKKMWQSDQFNIADILNKLNLKEYKLREIVTSLGLSKKTRKVKESLDFSIFLTFKEMWLNPNVNISEIQEESKKYFMKTLHEDTLRKQAKLLNLPNRDYIRSFEYRLSFLSESLRLEVTKAMKSPNYTIANIQEMFKKEKIHVSEEAIRKHFGTKTSKVTQISKTFDPIRFKLLWEDPEIPLIEIQKEFSGEFSPSSQRTILAYAEKLKLPKRPQNPAVQKEKFNNLILDNLIWTLTAWKDPSIQVTDIYQKLDISKRSLYNVTSRLGIHLGPKVSNSSRSKAEDEINNFILQINPTIKILKNQKMLNNKEIDIYLPDYNLGIEYNGIIHHCIGKNAYGYKENSKINKDYHLEKTTMSEELGIQLFHIFDTEYQDPQKKQIWNSMIKDRLGVNTKIGARKCSLVNITSKEARQFEKDNHLQGPNPASINLGLVYKQELVSLMTFGKGRNSISAGSQWELIRFCSRKNYTIQGGASKLFSHFKKTFKPKNIKTFANRRWSQGNLYEKLNFSFSHTSNPNYFYFTPKERILYSRNKFQKHKLKHLKSYDKLKTEWEIMEEEGYRKIYDSGNLVYTWNKD